jgi:microcystin-dependent protein
MSYQVTYTQSNNPDKQPITIQDGTVDNTTSLQIVGKNYAGYAPIIANNFLHLLENFANTTPPANPIQGQLWYDTNSNINLLYAYDGTTWNPVGSLKKQSSAPTSALAGDLWVDTTNSQLYLYSGSSFVLVGPQYSAGLQSGPIIETIVDTNNVSHTVTTMYSSSATSTTTSYRMAIISKDAFTPKATILGFSQINQGINLSSVDSNNATSLNRFWGTSSTADGLLVSSTDTLSASNVLRGDKTSLSNFPINIRNDGGITLGSGLSFNIGINSGATVLYSKTNGSSIEFATNNNGTVVTGLHLGANARLGVGPNNTNPQSALDVIGNVSIKDDPSSQATSWSSNTAVTAGQYFTSNNYYYLVTVSGTTGTISPNFTSGTATDGTATLQYVGTIPANPIPGRLVVSGTADIGAASGSPFDPGGASIQTMGGLSVNLSATVGTTLTVGGSSSSTSGAINVGADMNSASILPSSNGVYDIGSSSYSFRNIYATNFQGNFSGTITGDLSGSTGVAASAAKLQSPTTFVLTGDVTSPGVVFDGQTLTGNLNFSTTINSGIITSKSAATDSAINDQLLVYQASSSQLVSMTKQTLLKHVATMPVGAIMPFAGSTVPTGYLLCDGSEVQISLYSELFAVIQYSYRASSLLNGLSTFALPDLRGRFPLGADNMNNGLTVPSADGTGVLISAGGGPANRVTNITADVVGAASGNQTISLDTTNLPDHKHSLNDGNAQYYAVGSPASSTDPLATPGFGLTSQNADGQGFGLNNSGSVLSSTTGTPVTVMNPYATINYIIFTGVL